MKKNSFLKPYFVSLISIGLLHGLLILKTESTVTGGVYHLGACYFFLGLVGLMTLYISVYAYSMNKNYIGAAYTLMGLVKIFLALGFFYLIIKILPCCQKSFLVHFGIAYFLMSAVEVVLLFAHLKHDR